MSETPHVERPPQNEVTQIHPETQTFLQSLKTGDPLYLKNDRGEWEAGTFAGVNEGGLHGPVVQVDIKGETRIMYPKMLMDLQETHRASQENSDDELYAEAA